MSTRKGTRRGDAVHTKHYDMGAAQTQHLLLHYARHVPWHLSSWLPGVTSQKANLHPPNETLKRLKHVYSVGVFRQPTRLAWLARQLLRHPDTAGQHARTSRRLEQLCKGSQRSGRRNCPLIEKLTVSQLVNKLNAYYRIRRFITMLTIARHLSVPCARLI